MTIQQYGLFDRTTGEQVFTGQIFTSATQAAIFSIQHDLQNVEPLPLGSSPKLS